MTESRFGPGYPSGFDLIGLTGGNPALVEAALRDAGPAGSSPDPGRVPGPAYREAVVDCLHRGDPVQLEAARSLAVLLETPSLCLLSQLLRLDIDTLTRVVDVLTATGLLVDRRFRHPAAADAVLADMTCDERSKMHLRAALLLYSTASPAVSVARYLLAAGHHTHPWMVPVLEEAAAAQTCLLLTDILFARGDEEGGREAAAQAWELTTACGAIPLGKELRRIWAGDVRRGPFPWPARVTAAAAGAEIRRLTQGEARVARLAATGQTNQEIAGTLHVTVSTVEQHLTRVYRKLGMRNRGDLPVSLSQWAR